MRRLIRGTVLGHHVGAVPPISAGERCSEVPLLDELLFLACEPHLPVQTTADNLLRGGSPWSWVRRLISPGRWFNLVNIPPFDVVPASPPHVVLPVS